jgi:methanogenic corrinoid protein MtbC1
MASEKLFEEMTNAVIAGLPDKARELANEALRAGIEPLAAIEQGFKPGMDAVGEGFAKGELFIPDLMMSGEAMKAAIATLEPELMKRKQQRQVLGRVVIGTVQGDIHEIGKTLVATMLTANGFEVHDLGVDVPAQQFVDAVRKVNADVVGLSALLTTTILNQKLACAIGSRSSSAACRPAQNGPRRSEPTATPKTRPRQSKWLNVSCRRDRLRREA